MRFDGRRSPLSMGARRGGGFTLLETMIVCAIFTIIALVMFAIFSSSQDTFDTGVTYNAIQEQAARMFQDIERDFKEARFLQPPRGTVRNHTTVVLQCPVDNDGDGTTIDTSGVAPNVNAGEVEWGSKIAIVTIAGDPLYQITSAQTTSSTGASDDVGWYPGGYITYCFEPMETKDEGNDRIDYNMDGDLGDRFQLGRLVRIVHDFNHTEKARRTVLRDIIVNDSPVGDWDGHVHSFSGGAAVDDPIFKRVDTGQEETGTAENTVTGTQLTVNVWVMKLDSKKRALTRNMRNRFSVRIYSDADPTTADPYYPSTGGSIVTAP